MANDNPFLWWLPSAPAESKATENKPAKASVAAPAAAPMAGLQAKPEYLIRRAQQIAVAIFLEECAAFDLTPVQYAALVAIRTHPGIDATRVAGLIAFDRTTISGVLERLEAKGLLTRTASKDDKRIKILDLTAGGKKLLAGIEPHVVRVQARILAPLDREEQVTLMALLGRLVADNNDASRAPQRPLGDSPAA